MMFTPFRLIVAFLTAATFAASAYGAGPGPTPGIQQVTETVDCQGNLHQFVRDPQTQQLFYKRNRDFWYSLGGILTSEPKPIVGPDCVVRIFVRGSGLGVYMRTLTSGFVGWGGVAYSAPEPFVSDGRIAVAVVGTDNRLWSRTEVRGWGIAASGAPAPQDFPGINLQDDRADEGDFVAVDMGPVPGRAPATGAGPTPGIDGVSVAGTCDGRVLMFRRSPADSSLLYRDQSTPFWRSLGGYITSEPKALVDQACNLRVFARGSDLAVYYRNLTQGWVSLGGRIYSAPYLQLGANNTLSISAFGTDGRVWRRTMTTGWTLAN